MFARISTLSAITMATFLAVATAAPQSSSQCTTGQLNCCVSTQDASNPVTSEILGLLGIVLGDISGLVGFNCSPITGVGLSSSSCIAQPVCCTNNSFNGVVALGCSPISL